MRSASDSPLVQRNICHGLGLGGVPGGRTLTHSSSPDLCAMGGVFFSNMGMFTTPILTSIQIQLPNQLPIYALLMFVFLSTLAPIILCSTHG